MANNRRYSILIIFAGILSGLIGLLGEIAGNVIPDLVSARWKPYLSWSLPLFAGLTLIGILITLIQFKLEQSNRHIIAAANDKSTFEEFLQYLRDSVSQPKKHSTITAPMLSTGHDLSTKEDTHNLSAQIKIELLETLQGVGIVDCTTKLTESRFEPIECMKQAKRKLFFMGIVGSKWVTEPRIRDEFRQFLNRIQSQGGAVRFLMINPRGDKFRQLKSLRGGNISAESLKHFRSLIKEFPCLSVRLYDQMPCFRIVLIDDKTLALSKYRIDREGYFQSKFGWEAPHLIIDASAPWSFYDPFDAYYQQVWELSIDLTSFYLSSRRQAQSSEGEEE